MIRLALEYAVRTVLSGEVQGPISAAGAKELEWRSRVDFSRLLERLPFQVLQHKLHVL